MTNQKGDILFRDSNDYLTNKNISPSANYVLIADSTQDLGVDYTFVPTPPVKNDCINGTFDIWQRGTSHSSTGYGSADRWSMYFLGLPTTMSKESFTNGQTDVPNNPRYFGRFDVSTIEGLGTGWYSQATYKIHDVTKYSGKTLYVVFYARNNLLASDMTIEVVQNFGTGGSSSVLITPSKISLTTSWTKYVVYFSIPSVSGKTIGPLSYTRINFWFSAGSDFNSRTDSLGYQFGEFDFSEVEMYASNTLMYTLRRPKDETLNLCERYYQKSYNLDVTPDTVTNTGMYMWKNLSASTVYNIVDIPPFTRRMIQAPTVTIYCPQFASNEGYLYRDTGGVATAVPSGTTSSTLGEEIAVPYGIAPGVTAYYHWAADAEI